LSDWSGRLKRAAGKREKRFTTEWRDEIHGWINEKMRRVGYSQEKLNNIIMQKYGKPSLLSLNRGELISLHDWAIDLLVSKGLMV
jgi:hypothetical protein